MAWRVKIEPRDACLGDAICADTAPEVFEMDEDDLAIVIDTSPDPRLNDLVEQAARDCPAEIIVIEEVAGP